MSEHIDRISVLDSGFVEYVSHMGTDLTVVDAARVSFNKKSSNAGGALTDKDFNLIKYLAQHNHWTPFAHPQITLRIKAPISIRTQFFKHKQGFVENEISRRYVTFEPEFYMPSWRTSPTKGAKQGSEKFMEDGTKREICTEKYLRACSASLEVYNELIENNVAPEQARFVLPQGTYTEWWWTGSLAAYARVYKQRIDPHAQWEIREYASSIGKIMEILFPESWFCLTDSSFTTDK